MMEKTLTRPPKERPLFLSLLDLPNPARDDNLRPLSGEYVGFQHLGMSRRSIIVPSLPL